MTTKQRHHRRQVTVAVASLTAGLFATGLAIYLEAVPHALASAPTPVAERDALMESAIAPLDQREPFLPRLEGRAVADAAEVNLAPMRIVVGQSSNRFAKADFTSKGTCHPYWRDLASGPVGRHVLVTCPGEKNVPPEPVATLSNRGKLRLPTVATFNGQLPALQLNPDLLPSVQRADAADSAVNATLNRRWHAPRSGADSATGEVPRLPMQNPLSWTPSTKSAS